MLLEILICYDISDTKKRTKFVNQLKNFSFKGIQKSIMWGHISKAEKQAIKRLIKMTVDKEKDKIFFITSNSLSKQIKENGMGQDNSYFQTTLEGFDVL